MINDLLPYYFQLMEFKINDNSKLYTGCVLILIMASTTFVDRLDVISFMK